MARLAGMDKVAMAQWLLLAIGIVLEHHVHSLHDGFDSYSSCQ
jgi:hypothetical protein